MACNRVIVQAAMYSSLVLASFSALAGGDPDCPPLDADSVNGIPYADGKEKYNAGWTFYFDNDALVPSGGDKDYTYGVALTLAGRRARESWLSVDRLLGVVDGWTGVGGCETFELHSLQGGLVAFTPGDIGSPAVIEGDRPYGSIVYLANGRNYVRSRDSPVYQTSFAVGILGLGLVGELQNALHRAIGVDEAEGWNHQIADGGEPTIRYTIARQDLLASNFQPEPTEYEFKRSISGSVGYLTDASAALSLRWGRINTPWWSFPPERAEYIAEPAPVIGGTDIRPGSRELYVWSGVKVRARLYNAFLQGQFRESELDYGGSSLRPIIGEAWAGVTAQVSSEYRLYWVVRYQTSELRHGPGDREAIWGTLFISRDL